MSSFGTLCWPSEASHAARPYARPPSVRSACLPARSSACLPKLDGLRTVRPVGRWRFVAIQAESTESEANKLAVLVILPRPPLGRSGRERRQRQRRQRPPPNRLRRRPPTPPQTIATAKQQIKINRRPRQRHLQPFCFFKANE